MRKVFTRMITTLLSICFVLFGMPYFIMAEGDEEEVSIQISPQSVLYDIENMKPGDWAPRTVTIKNNGKRHFSYHVQINNKGPEKLLHELLLEIETAGDYLYNGKVSDFSQLSSRELNAGQKEDLEFTIRFPEHLGNEYQGLDTNFSLTFTAVDEKDENIFPDTSRNSSGQNESRYKPSDSAVASLNGTIGSGGAPGAELPKTSTNIYDILIIGGVLVISGGVIATYSRKRRKA